jgi:macrolide transport system ATP-binding/permease protein
MSAPRLKGLDGSPPVIELRDVSRVFGSDANPTYALRSASLVVRRGEFVAVIGPSGSGKSTLLNILGLLDRPSSGTHLINGVDVGTLGEGDRNRARAVGIGFVFQDSHVLLDETAADNAALGLKIRGIPVKQRAQRVTQALGRLELHHRGNARADSLSGGERQRVAIARAIATDPPLLLADEPTGSLDSDNSLRVINHLRALNDGGATVVVITHDPTVARAASRQVELIDGVLRDTGTSASEDGAGTRAPDLARLRIAATVDDPPAPRAAGSHTSARAGVGRGIRRTWDEILDAISAHTARPGRALLLLVAFLLGTGGLVCSLGISQSAAAQVTDRLTTASLDEVIVRATDPQGDPAFYQRGAPGNAVDPIEALAGVERVGYTATLSDTTARITLLAPGSVEGQTTFSGAVRVTDAPYLAAQNVSVLPGTGAALLDNPWGGACAVLGRVAAARLGIDSAGPGRVIHVVGRAVDVVGIIDDSGRDPSLDDTIILSRAAVGDMTPGDPQLLVRTLPGYPAPVAEAVPLAVNAGDPSTSRIETVADLRALQRGVATDLDSLVGLVSGVLLGLACLSAATAMYLSVQARASEIALRRAIGASRVSIWRIFTLEGFILGGAGGLSGSVAGLFGVLAVCSAQGWAPVLDGSGVIVGVVAGSITGILSAAYPALIAARADPAQAIRR